MVDGVCEVLHLDFIPPSKANIFLADTILPIKSLQYSLMLPLEIGHSYFLLKQWNDLYPLLHHEINNGSAIAVRSKCTHR